MAQNLISATLSTDDQAALLKALAELETRLPFLLGLSPEERRHMLHMSDESVGFVHTAILAASQNPELLPARSPVPGLQEDLTLIEQLTPVAERLARLNSLLNDTLTAARSDAYATSLDIYSVLQRTGKGEGLEELKRQMAKRFRRRARNSGETPEPPEAGAK